VKRPEADHVVVIGQICLNIDPGQFALIDVDDLDTTGSQRAKQLLLDQGCTASRISAELLPRLSSGDSRSDGNKSNAPRSQRASASNIAVSPVLRKRATMPQPYIARKERHAPQDGTPSAPAARATCYLRQRAALLGGNLPLRSTLLVLHKTQQCSDKVD
jgi:hypothetical protein